MACRIPTDDFLAMAQAELRAWGFDFGVRVSDNPDAGPLAEYDFAQRACILHKKPIQALVDEPEQARPLVRNLLRWADERRREVPWEPPPRA